MAIEKRFIHFKKFSDFNSKKLSANEANTQYTVGISGAIQTGSPDVLYQSYVWIKDTQQQWTHGQIYNGSDVDIDPSQYISWDDVDAELSETSTNPIQNQAVMNTLLTLEEVLGGLLDQKQPVISDLEAIRNGATKGATAVQPDAISEFITIDDVAKVATSGDYNDLTNKPTIPSAVTESTVSGWGFTKNTGTYSKPSTGIPKSDLASAVQTSLGKADTALQSYTEKYTGTITGISVNGTSVATSGVASIPAASTSKYGVTKLTSSTSSTSTTLAATASAVKAAYDLAKSFVPMTLNTSPTSFGASLRWSPNQKYASTAVLANNVTFNIDVSSIDTTKDNTWALSFILGTSARTISFSVSQTGYTIMWANGVAPTFEPNTAYEITFKLVGTNLFGVCGAFKTV